MSSTSASLNVTIRTLFSIKHYKNNNPFHRTNQSPLPDVFPEGELGDILRTVYEIKTNGLEYLFEALKGS
ncbi:MAG: DUF3820 family protein [Proteobacteria bacterium]|nr:DUF3820 family protein [Pseudomonadota bacterium]